MHQWVQSCTTQRSVLHFQGQCHGNSQCANSIHTLVRQTCLAADRSFCSSCCSVVWWRAWEEEAAWARWATCSFCMRCRHAVSNSKICATTTFMVHVISHTMRDSHTLVDSHTIINSHTVWTVIGWSTVIVHVICHTVVNSHWVIDNH